MTERGIYQRRKNHHRQHKDKRKLQRLSAVQLYGITKSAQKRNAQADRMQKQHRVNYYLRKVQHRDYRVIPAESVLVFHLPFLIFPEPGEGIEPPPNRPGVYSR
jgi:hypothetical protein